MSKKFNIGKINLTDFIIQKTDDIDKFMKINCFYCIRRDANITPETCYIKRKNKENAIYSVCSECKNDIENDFFNVIKNRILFSRDDISKEYIEKYKNNLLDYFYYYLDKHIGEKISIDKLTGEKNKKKVNKKTSVDNKEKEQNNKITNDKEIERKNKEYQEYIKKLKEENFIKIDEEKVDNNKEIDDIYSIEIDKVHAKMLLKLCSKFYRTPKLQILWLIRKEYEKEFGENK